MTLAHGTLPALTSECELSLLDFGFMHDYGYFDERVAASHDRLEGEEFDPAHVSVWEKPPLP